MNLQLQNLLEELYTLDPTLRTREKELKQIIEVLLKSKPDIKLDQNFRERLRIELQNHQPKQSVFNSINQNKMKKFNIYFGSALCLLLIAGAVALQANKNKQQLQLANGTMLGEGKIIRLADNAFGSLNNPSAGTAANTQPVAATPLAKSTLQQDVSNSTGSAPSLKPMSPMSLSTPASVPPANPLLRIYQPTELHYIYDGPAITIPSDKLEVLKKTALDLTSTQLNDSLKNLNLGLIDFGTFKNLNVDSFTVSEKDGYSITVDPKAGTINLYAQNQNYGGGCAIPLASPMASAGTSSSSSANAIIRPCMESQIKISDVPDDQTLIDAANKFIADHHISLKNYGAPEVVSDWKIQYEQSSDKATFYIPTAGTVLYPAQINGIGVYDQNGNKVGMGVALNFADQKVTSISELNLGNYQSSLYSTETDISKIMAIVEKGGTDTYYPADANAKTEDVQLGSPKLQLMTYWDYQNNNSTELFVPALIFPITKAPADVPIYKKAVVVPIIKDILSALPPPYQIMLPGIKK
ncbi:MAG: hypothetical protein JWO40_60 [Candidatus Doudnabacteria bacterium]|nr:hypothetical protein [Candidatus Doudnabacteria bacterium]